MSVRAGGCMCGAVRLVAHEVPDHFGACHCEMCRRWTGSALLAVTTPAASVSWEGVEHIGRIQSSDWAERAFCTRCGTGLYYHVTAEGAHRANIEIPIGLFDDPNGLSFRSEIYIDHKPDSYAYAGEGRSTMTRQQCIDAWGGLSQ